MSTKRNHQVQPTTENRDGEDMLRAVPIKQEAVSENSERPEPQSNGAPERVGETSSAPRNDRDGRQISMVTVEYLLDAMKQQTQILKSLVERPPCQQTPAEIQKYKMVNPTLYCGGVKELDLFLAELRCNFESHAHLFPRGGRDHVLYALKFLGTRARHTDPNRRQTKMMDPITWGYSLFRSDHPCMNDFSLFEKQIIRSYGDMDRRLNAGTRSMHERMQGPDETVREYECRIRTNWRDSEWIKHETEEDEHALYTLAWFGLREEVKRRVKVFTTGSDGRFKSIDEMFDIAAYVQAHPSEFEDAWEEEEEYESHSNEPQKGKNKRNSTPLSPKVSAQASKNGGSSTSTLPPAPWVSSKIYDIRKASGKCTRCAGDHKGYRCSRYSRADLPKQRSPAPTENQAKRQKS